MFPGLEYCPAAQAMAHPVVSFVAPGRVPILPFGQAVQALAVPAALYLPAEQTVQLESEVAFGKENLPAGHITGAENWAG